MLRGNRIPLAAAVLAAVVIVLSLTGVLEREGPLPSFDSQMCALPGPWLKRTQRGYHEPRSGQIALLPRYPAYMASGGGGWSHSGPWGYLQDVPLVFYGPGVVPRTGEVDRDATAADIAPTLMRLMHASLNQADGAPIQEAAPLTGRSLRRGPPRLILTVVWDGGGDNVLEMYPDSWPNLARFIRDGVAIGGATVGSNPSVTPAVHTTLGTGVFPATHGITGVPVRDENGEVVDAFLEGESGRFLRVPTIAELWDEQHRNRALVGMVGYEPWHLGMIGRGAEKPGGDRDDAVWLNVETNEWITNPEHYRLPPSISHAPGLQQELDALDARDGELDSSWRGHDILDAPDRVEETPAFIRYHTDAMLDLIEDEGYGRDAITDLVFTNYKQIDRLGHYFNMDSPEVRDALEESDASLARLEEGLDRLVGRGRWVIVVTADHGQQPDAAAVDGYGIDPREVEADIRDEFGPVVRAVWPTEVFLLEEEMERRGVTVAEVARFLGDYRLADNTQRPDFLMGGQGRFHPQDRIFQMAVPATLLDETGCPGRRGSGG